MISTQNFSHFEPFGNRGRFIKAVGYLDFDYLFAEVGVVQMGSFSKQMECEIHDLSITFNEIVHSNKFSFQPQHYLEGSYIPIFTFNCTMEMLGLQLLKFSLGSKFC